MSLRHLWDICLNYMLGVQMLPTNCKNAVDLDNRDVPTSNITLLSTDTSGKEY